MSRTDYEALPASAAPHPSAPAKPPVGTVAAAPYGAAAARQAPATQPRRRLRARRVLVGTGFLALLLCCFAVAAAWFAPPRPVALVLAGAGYEGNLSLPANSYGWHSLRDLGQTTQELSEASCWNRLLWRGATEPKRLTRGDGWEQVVTPQNARVWMLCLSAYGAVDDEGAYILPDDATLASKRDRLRMAALLSAVSQLPPQQHKIVVLDVVHREFDIGLGQIANPWVGELARLNEQIREIPNLVVICTSSADQRNWPCPALGRGVALHFWIEGSRGAASDEDQNGRVSLWELVEFVDRHTSAWVARQHNAAQNLVVLPHGADGEARARQIEVAFAHGDYRPSEPSLRAPATTPEELLAAWRNAQALARRPSPPYVHNPHRWRHYQAALARYGELLLCGDNAAAQRLAPTVSALAEACRYDSAALLASLDSERAMSSFPCSSAMPYDAEALVERAQQALDQLVATPPAERAAAWAKRCQAEGSELKALRAAVWRRVVDQAISDPVLQLRLAAQWAELTLDPLQPLPPDVQWITTLARDLPESTRTLSHAPLVAQSIRVRRLATHAATASEDGFTSATPLVWPWLDSDIAAADELRRQGQDLLLAASTDAEFAQCQAYFDSAEKRYSVILAQGRALRHAFEVRDRALAVLPEATMLVLEGNSAKAQETLLAANARAPWIALWRDVHDLSRQLEVPPQGATPKHTTPESLAAASSAIERQLALVEARLQELPESATQAPWTRTVDLEARRATAQTHLANLQREREQLEQVLRMAATRGPSAPAADEAMPVALGTDFARSRGELALAMIGPEALARFRQDGEDDWAQAQHRLAVFAVEPAWRDSMQQLGAELTAIWQRVAAQIQDASAPAAGSDIGRALPPTLSLGGDDVQGDARRRERLATYLAAQAERIWRDHWQGAPAADPPYYLVLSRALLSDAQRAAPQTAAIARVQKLIDGPAAWQLVTPQQPAITPELAANATLEVQLSTAAPFPGYSQLTYRYDGQTHAAPPLAWNPTARGQKITLPLAGDVAAPLEVTHYFRGLRMRKELKLNAQLVPSTLSRTPAPPPAARVLVEASPAALTRFGQGSGAVAIVLDASGSMGARQGETFSANTRYAQAVAALDTMLAALPAQTQLSVWIFGEAVGAQKTAPKAEDTIRRVRALSPWNPATRGALIKSLSYPAIEPWNESSVVHAMLAAKDEIAQVRGPKSLLVITDGLDNRFAQDQVLNPKHVDVATGLTQGFDGTGIAVHVVGFQIATAEAKAMAAQFSVIESWTPPGRLYRVEDAGALARSLAAACDQRLRYWAEDFAFRPLGNSPSGGKELSASQATSAALSALQIPAGDAQLRLIADRTLRQPLYLDPGAALWARLDVQDDAAVLTRPSTLTRFYPTARAQDAGAWRVAVLDSLVPPRKVSALALAIERNFDPTATPWSVIAPHDVWWEVTLPGGQPPPRLTITRSYDTMVPAWQMDVAPAEGALPWTAPISVTLRGWWLPADTTVGSHSIRHTLDSAGIAALAGTTFTNEERTITLSAAQVRDPKSGEVQIVFDGPPGSVLWPRLRNSSLVGIERRHYRDLGRCVLRFTLPATSKPGATWTWDLLDLKEFQAAAEERGCAVQLTDVLLPAP